MDSLQPDLRLSVLKPLHARWMMDALAELTVNRQLVFQGWEASGIFGALQTIHNGATSCRTKEEDATKNEEEQTPVAEWSTNTAQLMASSIREAFTSFSPVHVHHLPGKVCIESQTRDGGIKKEKLMAFGLISAVRAIPVEVTDLTNVCQSPLDGRKGSNACTVIACHAVQQYLSAAIALPKYADTSFLAPSSPDFVTPILRFGNSLYDKHAVQLGSPYLSTFEALKLCPKLGLKIIPHGEMDFVDAETCLEKVQALRLNPPEGPAGGVFTAKARSVAVFFSTEEEVVVFDRHSHGCHRGALVAVGSGIAPILHFLCNRLFGGLTPRRRG